MFLAIVLGTLIHVSSSYKAAGSDEGPLWLWTSEPDKAVDRLARVTFFLWLASTLVLLLPIDLKIAIGVQAAFLLFHTLLLAFHNV